MYYVNPISLANKVLNRLEVKAGRSRLISRPVEVTVEPTLMCNSDCLMCNRNFHRKGDKNVSGFLTWETLNKVKPFLRTAERVVFSGFGEPLLHPEFLDMARMIKKEGPHVLFFTNALRLTEDIARGLADTDLDAIYVSMGGGTRETYKKIRGVDGFDDVVRNIEALTRYKRLKKKNRPAVYFNVVAMTSVLDELEEIVSLADRIGVEAVDMPNLVVHGDAVKEESLWLCPERATAAFNRASILAERLHVGFRSPRITECRLDCRHFFTSFYLAWDGQVLSCPQERYIIGNVKDTSLSGIWNGSGIIGLREEYHAGGLDSTCPKCPCWDNRSKTHLDSWPNSREYAQKVPPCL